MQRHVQKSVIYFSLLLLVVICFLPFYMVMVNASRAMHQIISGFSLLPSKYFLANTKNLLSQIPMFRGMLNTVVIAVSVTVLSVYFSALTAFGFQFYEFKGKRILFGVILLSLMVPAQLGLIGFYKLCVTYKIIDTYIPLILPSVASAFTVFFIRQYMSGNVHPAIIDAARIDGTSEIGIFHRIVFPLASPAIVTTGLMTFIGTWNSYIASRILIFTPKKQVLSVMVGMLKARIDGGDLGVRYAGIAISITPIIIIFVLASKYIVSNISAGSVKG